ncbi:MAG TPA: crosslink repair DNA glycosylase YcaQ family protein [Steroidobacteraceae bacterium]
MRVTLDHLRSYAIARSLFKPTTLRRAIDKLGFVQADPIRAPARAQDLTLRHRVAGYRAGDLERRYPQLPLEEDFFVNYGYLPRAHHQLMHPRTPRTVWTPARAAQAAAVLEFVRERGTVHPREVDAHFAHGKVTNWFGGSSNASTELLDVMHYRGLLRVARREGGTRIYAARETPAAAGAVAALPDDGTASSRMDALVDVVVRKYAPLSASTLGQLVSHLRGGAPQWTAQRGEALARAKRRLAHARIDGIDWYWPAADRPSSVRWRPDESVRLLTPFDPIVWDRRRFEIFWGWAYRFEAYTPAAKRKLGYYALPLLWHERVIGWGNVTATDGDLRCTFGYTAGRAPRAGAFRAGLEAELARMRTFLGMAS